MYISHYLPAIPTYTFPLSIFFNSSLDLSKHQVSDYRAIEELISIGNNHR